MNNASDWVIIGRFGRPHGIKGFVSIVSFTEPREDIINYANWHFFDNDNQWQAITSLKTEINNKFILAKIDGYDTREQVGCLTNRNIAINRAQLKKLAPNEYYWHQLIGMTVVNQADEPIGIVDDIMATGSNDVLIVTGKRRVLIPFLLGDVILAVDDVRRIIMVEWDLDF